MEEESPPIGAEQGLAVQLSPVGGAQGTRASKGRRSGRIAGGLQQTHVHSTNQRVFTERLRYAKHCQALTMQSCATLLLQEGRSRPRDWC